jgi:hypothetical protein
MAAAALSVNVGWRLSMDNACGTGARGKMISRNWQRPVWPQMCAGMLRVPPRRLYLSIAGGAWDIGADFRVGADPSSAIGGPLRGRGRAVRLARAPKGRAPRGRRGRLHVWGLLTN